MKPLLTAALLAMLGVAGATTIHDVQYSTVPGPQGTWPSPLAGQSVTLEGVVAATGYYSTRWFLADPAGGPWSGLLIWNPFGSLHVGDRVRVSGTVTEYNGHTELSPVTSTQLLGHDGILPPAAALACSDLQEECWEGVLCRLGPVTVSSGQDSYGQWRVADAGGSCEVDDAFFDLGQAGIDIIPGQGWESLTGLADFQNNGRALNPRTAADLQSGATGVAVSLGHERLALGETGSCALSTSTLAPAWNLLSFELGLSWNPALASLEAASLEGTLAQGRNLSLEQPEPGRAWIHTGEGPALAGAGELLRLSFRGLAQGETPLTLDSFTFHTTSDPIRVPGSLSVVRAPFRGDTLTLVQRPLPTLPSFLLPGDSLEVWCEAAPEQAGWWMALRQGERWLQARELRSDWQADQGWWRLRASFPDPGERLWDLVVGATGLPPDTVRQAVMSLPAFEESFCFAHVTDTHLPSHYFYPSEESATDSAAMEDLRAVWEDLNLIHPAFVLHTGDLVNEGELEDLELRRVFSRAQGLLGECELPLFLTAGNHDIGGWPATPEPAGTARRTWWRFFGWRRLDNPPPGAPWRTQNASFDYGPLHVALLEAYDNYDNWRPEIYGPTSFIQEQLEWLQADLATQTRPFQMLATHFDFANQVPAGYQGLELILMGHIHSSSGDGAGPPWRLTTEACTDGGRSYRLVRVGPGGLDPRPVLSAGATGEQLRVQWLGANDGSLDSLSARVINNQPEAFPKARLVFHLAAGVSSVHLSAGLLHALEPEAGGTRVEVDVDLPAVSNQVIRVVGNRRPAAPQNLRIELLQGGLLLEWEEVPEAAGYRVESSPLPGALWSDVTAEGTLQGAGWTRAPQSGARMFRVVALAP